MAEQGARITQVSTVAVATTDQDAVLAFYVGTLGLEKRMEAPFGDGQRWIEVGAPGAVTTIALQPNGPGATVGVDTGIRLTTEDAGAAHVHLAAKGVDVDPDVMRWPGVPPMFSLRDPDGNTLYIVEAM